MSDHQYEVVMSNGDRTEADSIEGIILAARTLWEDTDKAIDLHVADITRVGESDAPVLATVRRMLLEWQIGGST